MQAPQTAPPGADSAANAGLDFTEEEIQLMLDNLDTYTPEEQAEIDKIADILHERKTAQSCQEDLIAFCRHIQPDYIVGRHHRTLANLLMAIADGKKDRVCVNIPPRHGKSQLVSIYFPAWFIGKYPNKKVLMVSHTTDLAVDFGRKVRNIIDSPEYQRIFPKVSLAADSKSAGRWNTSAGGEYFACIRQTVLVSTQRGYIPADQIRLGDTLYNAGSNVTVRELYVSQHAATYTIAGLACSDKHPIWTLNRGWVYADEITPTDILATESIFDRLKVLVRRTYGYLEHTNVSALVQHKVPLHQSQQRKMGLLWRARDYVMQTVAGVRKFFSRYGATANSEAYCGADKQRRSLQSKELSVGRRMAASKQQTHQQSLVWAYVGATCAGYGDDAAGRSLSVQQRNIVDKTETAEETLRAYGSPENIGWLRSTAAPVLARSSKRIPGKSHYCVEKYLAGAREAAQKLCGILLGVRRVGKIVVTCHDVPQRFVNFLTDGDHTFFANGVLTHNCGVGSALAGRGADLLLVDDPHNEQDIINGNFDVFDKAYEWFTYGARTRLMPGGRVAIIQTRWHQDDLSGRVMRDMTQNERADQYEVVEFPAILEVPSKDNPDIVTEKPLWPEFFDLEALHRTKASMPVFQWNAQYQQNPTAEEASVVKREWWNIWTKEDPPPCEYVIMTLDAAAETHNRADYTALTTWGVWYNEEREGPGAKTYNIILLNSIKRRLEFPELKELSYEEYKFWEPDAFIVEKKSAGTALYQELRRMGIPVGEYTPHRGSGDKLARLNSVADIVRSGLCWVPETRWAEEVVEEIAGFPFMSHDDLCVAADTMVLMASGVEVPITQVGVGDYVQTPAGPRKVTASHCTGVRTTYEIHVGGRALRITDNHPIATLNGWKPLRELNRNDAIIHVSQTTGEPSWGQRVVQRLQSKLLNLTGGNTVGILTQKIHRIDVILRELGIDCTEMYGSSISGQYPRGTTSTISTRTPRITTLATLRAYLRGRIKNSGQIDKPSTHDLINSGNTLRLFASRPRCGTSPQRDERGIENTQKLHSLKQTVKRFTRTCQALKEGAKNVAQRFLVKPLLIFYALPDVQVRDTIGNSEPKNWRLRIRVQNVGPNFIPYRQKHFSVAPSAETITIGHGVSESVYNLSVEGVECYYANGVLVHNCDSTVMALMRFRQGGFIRLPTDEPEPLRYFKSRGKNRYY